MNKDRREKLLEVLSTIDEVRSQIQDVIDEENEAIDNLPESLQGSERAMKMTNGIEYIESLIALLDNFDKELYKVLDYLKPKSNGKSSN